MAHVTSLGKPGDFKLPRYVYKFVCDPEALFQMALAENHRAALKLEATTPNFPTPSSRSALAEASGRNRHQVELLKQNYS